MFTRVFVGMRAYIHTHVFWGFPGGSVVTEVAGNLHTMQKTWVQSLGQEDPWRRKWQPTPVFLPGETRRERSLAGYSPRGRKEAGMTERLNNIRRYAYVCMCASLFFFFLLCRHTKFKQDKDASFGISLDANRIAQASRGRGVR